MGIYICREKVTVADIGQDYKISNKGMLRLLQEAANLASNEVGHGINDMEKNGTTWVILYWRLNIIKRVNYNSELKIKTWASFDKKIYSIRSFEVYNEENELVAKADSKWVYVNYKTHAIEKIPAELIEKYGDIKEGVFEEKYNDRVKMPDNLEEIYTYKIMKRDLDANHHVNNIAFLDIAIEALPEEYRDINFSNISLVFKKELLYKNNVTCYYNFEDEKHVVYLYTKEDNTLNGIVKFG